MSEFWGPIDLKQWRATPVTEGRTAKDEDVALGRAVFAVGGEPVELRLPAAPSSAKRESERPLPSS